MAKELELIEALRERLLALGYPAASIRVGVGTGYGRFIDLAIYESNQAHIVFEVKSSIGRPELNVDGSPFFNSMVRQAQFLAQEVNAPFFAVFNGVDIAWYRVDDQDGRPKRLEGPVPLSQEVMISDFTEDPEQPFRVIYKIRDLVAGRYSGRKTLAFVGMAVLNKLHLEATGETATIPMLERTRYRFGNNVIDDRVSQDISALFDESDHEDFARASAILGDVTLSRMPSNTLIAALDDIVRITRDSSVLFKLPPQLTELIALLTQAESEETLLDVYSNFGDGTAAVVHSFEEVNVTSIASDEVSYLWDFLKRVLTPVYHGRLLYMKAPEDFHLFTADLSPLARRSDKVMVTPPFGGRVKDYGRNRYSEEYFLEAALDFLSPGGRIVTLLPENFLFSQRFAGARELVSARVNVRAVISLEQFMPGTSVKASIVVLENDVSSLNRSEIAMLRLSTDTLLPRDDRQAPALATNQIELLLRYLLGDSISDAALTTNDLWFIDSGKLSRDSWSVGSYVPHSQFAVKSAFPVMPLKEIAVLRKGSTLTLKQDGNLLVIGPSAVRKWEIDASKLDRTTEEQLTSHPVVAIPGDVLVHAVSTYRGQATEVAPSFEGLHISRNIIVVRPDPTRLLPGYLAVALNGEFVAQQLAALSGGSVIRQLTVRTLGEALIPVPDLETQQLIAEQVKRSLQKIASARRNLVTGELALAAEERKLQQLVDSFQEDIEL